MNYRTDNCAKISYQKLVSICNAEIYNVVHSKSFLWIILFSVVFNTGELNGGEMGLYAVEDVQPPLNVPLCAKYMR